MYKKLLLLTFVLLPLISCADYYRAQANATEKRMDAIPSSAQRSMDINVCQARANAAFPDAASMERPLTLKERARLIEWEKVDDACWRERGEPSKFHSYPTMDYLKRCDRRSREEMPSATIIERNDYIDACLEASGFAAH